MNVSSLPTTRINLNFDKEVERRKGKEKEKKQVDIATEWAKRWKGEDCFDRCRCRMFPEYIREKLNYEEGTIRSIPQPPFCALAIVERNYYSTATFLSPLPGQTNFVSRSELQIRTLFMYYGSVVFGRPPPDSWMKFNWSTPLPRQKITRRCLLMWRKFVV